MKDIEQILIDNKCLKKENAKLISENKELIKKYNKAEEIVKEFSKSNSYLILKNEKLEKIRINIFNRNVELNNELIIKKDLIEQLNKKISLEDAVQIIDSSIERQKEMPKNLRPSIENLNGQRAGYIKALKDFGILENK